MEAFDFERDPKFDHNLKFDPKMESEQDVDFKEELQDASLDTPNKELQCRQAKQ